MVQTDWPILVLTLVGDDARRQPLLTQLAEAGLSWQLLMGVDGRRGLPAEYLPLIDREAAQQQLRRPMTDCEFACALSHRTIYQTILDKGWAGAVVLEDDAILTPDFAEFLRGGFHRVKTMALLDYRFGRALRWQRRRVGRWTLYRAAQRATLTSAYTLSRKSAADLLAVTTPVSQAADWPADLHDLDAWLVVPRIADHNEPGAGPSHLEGTRRAVACQGKHRGRYLEARYWRGLIRRKLARKVGR
ncbi:glycosyltransferase family 25 protein [Paracoccus limosus]|nr:glycosyltransferase family 25 protein [Paracoccus limosus]